MQTFYVKNSFVGGGVKVANVREITADNLIYATDTITAGVAGTAGADGVMTMPTGHGFTDNMVVCVSGTFGAYYNGVVSSAGANAITVSGGAGDSLPTSGAVVVSKMVELDMAFAGSNAKAIFIGADADATVTLETSGAVQLAKSTVAGGAYQWDSGNGESNPITSDAIVKAHAFNRETTASTVTVMIGYDND